ncbi:MAG: glucuronate isomerase [Robiginitomaculum sp.]|nr:glucuronate isomerase [Robiginitomaculum sp.]
MHRQIEHHPDRLLPTDKTVRKIARTLYEGVQNLPIISPHGHTDPAWFATNAPFDNPTDLFVTPDHYIFRMLYSQGVDLAVLGVGQTDTDPRKAWGVFAEHYYLFRGTPTRIWMNYVFKTVFNIDIELNTDTADEYYDIIAAKLSQKEYLPRALFDRFNIELLATTDSPLDDLAHHKTVKKSGWAGRVIPTFRPDPVVDPEFEGFVANIAKLGEICGEDTSSYAGYLSALRNRRAFFIENGATATDHGHPTAFTADLPKADIEALFAKALKGGLNQEEAEYFRGHMLTEMASMSVDDGLVMQIHPGSYRNHNRQLFQKYGRDVGADIPVSTEYVHNLKALLDKHGNDPELTIILFTLDETTYSRELAPLAGHYPALKLGPAWWFHDSPEGMRRYRERVTETAGFYNTVGFNDDTRAFLSIPARHDVARRMDCSFLAHLVCDHRLGETEAHELAQDLSYNLVKSAYKL